MEDEEAGQTAWEDLHLVETHDGSQELVVENLDQLKDSTALIVTRHGDKFKIGITQNTKGAGPVGSERANSQRASHNSGHQLQQSLN